MAGTDSPFLTKLRKLLKKGCSHDPQAIGDREKDSQASVFTENEQAKKNQK